MTDVDDTAKLGHLAGQVSALQAFALAVIATHRKPHHLFEEFVRLSDNQITWRLPLLALTPT